MSPDLGKKKRRMSSLMSDDLSCTNVVIQYQRIAINPQMNKVKAKLVPCFYKPVFWWELSGIEVNACA